LDIRPGGNGDIEFHGDNLMGFSPSGMMPETDDALQLNDDLVGHEDGDVYVNDDDDERDDDLRHVDEMPHHVFVAPPPNPEPSEGGFVFGAASCGAGSSSNTRSREDAENVAPSSRPVTGTFGPNQRDFRLTVPSIVTSWAQQSVAEISVPVSGRISVSDLSGIQDESQRGSLESGGLARAWLSSLSNREAFSNLTTREIRNSACNARSYLEREARHLHLTQQQRDLLETRLKVYEERRASNRLRQERFEEAAALRGVQRLLAQRARGRAPVLRGPRPNPMPSGRSGASGSGERGSGGRGRVVVGDARALIRQNDRRREIRDAIDIAAEVYCERQRAAGNEAAYWGRRAAFLQNAGSNVLGPRLSSSGLGARASSSSLSASSTSSRGRRGAGPRFPSGGDRRRPDMNRR
jgi:hypothetical protein